MFYFYRVVSGASITNYGPVFVCYYIPRLLLLCIAACSYCGHHFSRFRVELVWGIKDYTFFFVFHLVLYIACNCLYTHHQPHSLLNLAYVSRSLFSTVLTYSYHLQYVLDMCLSHLIIYDAIRLVWDSIGQSLELIISLGVETFHGLLH